MFGGKFWVFMILLFWVLFFKYTEAGLWDEHAKADFQNINFSDYACCVGSKELYVFRNKSGIFF